MRNSAHEVTYMNPAVPEVWSGGGSFSPCLEAVRGCPHQAASATAGRNDIMTNLSEVTNL